MLASPYIFTVINIGKYILFDNENHSMTNRSKLVLIKITHTIAWAFFVFCILYVLYAGIGNIMSKYVIIAIVLVIMEGAVLLFNGWKCPLTNLAEKYTNDRKDNFDIYLPAWLARYNKTIFTTLFMLGIILLILRQFFEF